MADRNRNDGPPTWAKVLFIVLGVLGGLILLVGLCFIAVGGSVV